MNKEKNCLHICGVCVRDVFLWCFHFIFFVDVVSFDPDFDKFWFYWYKNMSMQIEKSLFCGLIPDAFFVCL